MKLYCVWLVYFFINNVEYNSKCKWEVFKLEFDKTYESAQEEDKRFLIFTKTLKTIDEHNNKKHSRFKLGVNFYADISAEEFLALNDVSLISEDDFSVEDSIATEFDMDEFENASSSLDWRLHGAVTNVKDQKLCGSCFIMATIASIESHLYLTTGKLHDLSVQEVLDCGGKHQSGCDGGFPYLVYHYVNSASGISLEADYPYQSEQKECRSTIYPKIEIPDFKYFENPSNNEVLLQAALEKFGPIVVFLNISYESFMRYSRGIYFEADCTHNTNHVALLVGYGSEIGADFWIVKNSYGEKWGEDGYIRIARNQDNHCGIGRAYYVLGK